MVFVNDVDGAIDANNGKLTTIRGFPPVYTFKDIAKEVDFAEYTCICRSMFTLFVYSWSRR